MKRFALNFELIRFQSFFLLLFTLLELKAAHVKNIALGGVSILYVSVILQF